MDKGQTKTVWTKEKEKTVEMNRMKEYWETNKQVNGEDHEVT